MATYTQTVDLDALLKATDEATVSLDVNLKAQDSTTVALDVVLGIWKGEICGVVDPDEVCGLTRLQIYSICGVV